MVGRTNVDRIAVDSHQPALLRSLLPRAGCLKVDAGLIGHSFADRYEPALAGFTTR